jgi:transcriptional regulator with XRE-family HTH domain
MLLSLPQLKRVERGEVSVRFLPALRFCEFTDTNPLWLAFGDPENPFGFYWIQHTPDREVGYRVLANITGVAASEVAGDAIFLEVMQRHKRDYQAAGRSMPTTETQRWSLLRGIVLDRDYVSYQLTNQRKFGNVGSMKLQRASFWPELRERIRKLVQQRGMKSALARDIGVSRQAINSLLSKKRPYVPSAEYALRLSKWVEIAKAQQKKAPLVGKHEQRKQPEKRKSKHEKPHSDHRKKR